MNSYLKQKLLKLRPLLSALTVLAIAGFALPQASSAAIGATTAKAKIVNVATVTYKDISGNGGGSANAAAVVTVQLKKSSLTFSNPPVAGEGNPTLACTTPFSTYSSGKMDSKLIALTATANGQDTYALSSSATYSNTPAIGANGTIYDYYAMNKDGKNFANNVALARGTNNNPAGVTLGSAIVLGFSKTADATPKHILNFPGGALEGFTAGDMVVVETAAGKQAYLVKDLDAGMAKTHTHETAATDPNGYADAGSTSQPEEQGWMEVEQFTTRDITLQNGKKVTVVGDTPDFSPSSSSKPTIGVPVGEMVLIELDVTSWGTSTTDPGYVNDKLIAAPSTTTPVEDTDTKVCLAGNFDVIALMIEKRVRNITQNLPSGATNYAKSADGKPSDVMEYEITVTSPKSVGSLVTVTDTTPTYTKLLTFATAYGGTADGSITLASYFGKIEYGPAGAPTATASVKGTGSGTADIGYGSASAVTGPPAATSLTLYLGQGSSGSAGGKLPFCTNGTYTNAADCTTNSATWVSSIRTYYRVKID